MVQWSQLSGSVKNKICDSTESQSTVRYQCTPTNGCHKRQLSAGEGGEWRESELLMYHWWNKLYRCSTILFQDGCGGAWEAGGWIWVQCQPDLHSEFQARSPDPHHRKVKSNQPKQQTLLFLERWLCDLRNSTPRYIYLSKVKMSTQKRSHFIVAL